MNHTISPRFDADVEQQVRWYLVEAGLDPEDANRLANRFVQTVDDALEFLTRHPESGRRRFTRTRQLIGIRSWALGKPFARFLIFYRLSGGGICFERLLEGHRREAAL